MVKDYVQEMYEPIARRADAMTANDFARARALAEWQQRVKAAWGDVAIESVQYDPAHLVADLWTTRQVQVDVRLGQLTPDDVSVELLHGPVGPTGELTETSTVPLTLALAPAVVGAGATDAAGATEGADGADGARRDGRYRYQGTFTCERAGRYGIATRAVPSHPDLAVPAEMGCVTWA
jgi:starch phosphorylase